MKCDKCEVECTVKRLRYFDCSTAHDNGMVCRKLMFYKVANNGTYKKSKLSFWFILCTYTYINYVLV